MTDTNITERDITAVGGWCPGKPGPYWKGPVPDPMPHSSTSHEIDASRFVSVYICDLCGSLFVPRKS